MRLRILSASVCVNVDALSVSPYEILRALSSKPYGLATFINASIVIGLTRSPARTILFIEERDNIFVS